MIKFHFLIEDYGFTLRYNTDFKSDDCNLADLSSRAGCAAARLRGSRVRNPPEACMSVNCECCVFQVKASATDQSLVQGSVSFPLNLPPPPSYAYGRVFDNDAIILYNA